MTNARWIADLNGIAVTVEDLRRATDEVHRLKPKDRNWEGRLFAMVRLFEGEPMKGLAVEHRLVAMSRMIESDVLPGWVLPKQDDSSVAVAGPVWEATASEPLVFGEGEPAFDQEAFLSRVLSLAETEGHA